MKWKTIKIGDCCTKIGSGSTPKGGSSVYKEDGVSFIRSQNVHNLEFNYDGLAHIDEKTAKKLNNVSIEENDVLLNITGDSVARTCVVPRNILPARVNQHVSIIRTKRQVINPLYLNFYLASPSMQSYMLGLAFGKGSSRNALTKQIIENFEISCPPIKIQESIASILSHYDDLIEINKRRIALLEESARELYKEWFVRMRFPGWRKEKTTAGIPPEWEIKNISQICDISAGKDRPEQVSPAKSKEFPYPIYSNGVDNNGLYGFASSPRVANNCITISARGTIGFVVLHLFPFVPIVRLLVLVPQKENLLYYLYLWAKCRPIEGNGTSQQQLTVPMIGKEKIIIPTEEILDQFNTYINELVGIKDNLIHANELLSLQRDRLLPRLMSGQLEV